MGRQVRGAVSAVAMMWGVAAAAQTEPPAAATAPADPARAAAGVATPQTEAGTPAPADIVVTAERRNTSLQRSSVAATVLTGADLAKKGVRSIEDLQFATPSLTVQNFGQGNQFNIRGIGKSTGGAAVNVGVVTYRDGVATFPGYFQSEPFYDIADVEVLRGPQGTFVGQNATGGAVFITEQNPTLDGIHGYGQFQYGNYSDVGGQGAVNVPITSTLAVRGAFNIENRGSFYTIDGDHGGHPGRLRSDSGRLSLLWEPTSQWKILLKGDYNNINMGGYVADPAIATNDPFHVGNNAPVNKAKDESGRIVLNASYTTDGGVIVRSISGYQQGTSTAIGDYDGTDILNYFYAFPAGERILSQEINIISPDDKRFTWLLGGYYQNDKGTYTPGEFFLQTPAGTSYTEGHTYKTSGAAFAQLGYKIVDGLQLQGGVRYSRSSSRNAGDTRSVLASGVTSIVSTDSDYDDDAVTGKVALNWTVNRNHFLYAFVATGYKSGGLNVAFGSPDTRSFGPEHVTDFEVGWKGSLFDGHLRTQVGGYYNRYKDLQIRISDPTNPATAPFQNVPSITKIAGVEASAQASFGRFSLDVTAAYLHSKLGRFFAADPRLAPNPPCDAESGPVGPKCFDLTGRVTTYAPKLTGNIGAQYAFPIRENVTLTPRINYAHLSGSWGSLFQNAALGDRLEPRNIINAQVTLAGKLWSVTGYTTNATDLTYISAVNNNLRYAGPPRQYGIRLARSF